MLVLLEMPLMRRRFITLFESICTIALLDENDDADSRENYNDENGNHKHDLKGERPTDEDAGVDVATVALLEAEVARTCGSKCQSSRRSTITR